MKSFACFVSIEMILLIYSPKNVAEPKQIPPICIILSILLLAGNVFLNDICSELKTCLLYKKAYSTKYHYNSSTDLRYVSYWTSENVS